MGECDNGAMKHVALIWKPLQVGVWAILLSGCVTNPAATTGGPDKEKADEAAVRRTLADLEQRINRSDPSFVDVFAKDAVIIAPAAPDVVGFDAIQTMYNNLMNVPLAVFRCPAAQPAPQRGTNFSGWDGPGTNYVWCTGSSIDTGSSGSIDEEK